MWVYHSVLLCIQLFRPVRPSQKSHMPFIIIVIVIGLKYRPEWIFIDEYVSSSHQYNTILQSACK